MSMKINEYNEIVPATPSSGVPKKWNSQTLTLIIVSSLLGLALFGLGGFFWYSGANNSIPTSLPTAMPVAVIATSGKANLETTAPTLTTPSAEAQTYNVAFEDLFNSDSLNPTTIMRQLPVTISNLKNLKFDYHVSTRPDAATLLFLAYYRLGVQQSQQDFQNAPASFQNALDIAAGNPNIEQQITSDPTLLPKGGGLNNKQITNYKDWTDDIKAHHDEADIYRLGTSNAVKTPADWDTAITNWNNLYKIDPLYLYPSNNWIALRLYDAYKQKAAAVCGNHDAGIAQLKLASQLVKENIDAGHPIAESGAKVDDLIKNDKCI